MRFIPINHKDVTRNQIFTREDFLGNAIEVVTGDLNDLQSKSLTAVSNQDIDAILQFGFTIKNGDVITTYNWKLDDSVFYAGEEYFISSMSIVKGAFIVEIFSNLSWTSINNSIKDFEASIDNGTYTLKKGVGSPKISLTTSNCSCSEYRSDCNIVDSYMLSGEKFRYCRAHKKEVK